MQTFPAIYTETGGGGSCDDEHIASLRRGLRLNVMRELGMIDARLIPVVAHRALTSKTRAITAAIFKSNTPASRCREFLNPPSDLATAR